MSMSALGEVETPVTFDYLARYRKLLREFCRFHVPSLLPFASDEFAVFAVTLDKKPTEFSHITSSATCFSSLDLCLAELGHGKKQYLHDLGRRYADSAINSVLKDKWRSDSAAQVYCTCRGLPYVLTRLDKWHLKIDEHLKRVIYQLEPSDGEPRRFAVGEANPPEDGETRTKAKSRWYPPNAYHTYWALEILRALEGQTSRRVEQRAKIFARSWVLRNDCGCGHGSNWASKLHCTLGNPPNSTLTNSHGLWRF